MYRLGKLFAYPKSTFVVVIAGTCLSTVNAEPVGTMISALMLSSCAGLSPDLYMINKFACSPTSSMLLLFVLTSKYKIAFVFDGNWLSPSLGSALWSIQPAVLQDDAACVALRTFPLLPSAQPAPKILSYLTVLL